MEVLSGEAARAAVAGEACNLMLYGGPGLGKTTEAVKAFIRDGRCTAFFAQCEPGSLKPIAATDLPMPDTFADPRTGQALTIVGWAALWTCLVHVAQNRNKYNALIVDTLTEWTSGTAAQLKEQGVGGKNAWAIPNEIYNYLATLRQYARALGVHVVYIAHAAEPYVEDGVFHAGGPLTTPKKAAERFYGAVDTMLRVDKMIIANDVHRVYHTGGLVWDTPTLGMRPPSVDHWFCKNREGVQQAIVPANLGAYLRARKPPYPGL